MTLHKLHYGWLMGHSLFHFTTGGCLIIGKKLLPTCSLKHAGLWSISANIMDTKLLLDIYFPCTLALHQPSVNVSLPVSDLCQTDPHCWGHWWPDQHRHEPEIGPGPTEHCVDGNHKKYIRPEPALRFYNKIVTTTMPLPQHYCIFSVCADLA